MKKSVLIFTMLIGCLLLGSCAISADQMLEEFNGQIYEDLGGGVYITQNGKINVSSTLIPRNGYTINENGILQVDISPAYMEYSWTLVDNKTKTEYKLDKGFYIVFVGLPDVSLKADRDYTLTVVVRNKNGLLFTDSATINVV